MASYTVILLKKFAARPRGEGFSLQRGEAKILSVAKMKFRSSARPDLRITLLSVGSASPPSAGWYVKRAAHRAAPPAAPLAPPAAPRHSLTNASWYVNREARRAARRAPPPQAGAPRPARATTPAHLPPPARPSLARPLLPSPSKGQPPMKPRPPSQLALRPPPEPPPAPPSAQAAQFGRRRHACAHRRPMCPVAPGGCRLARSAWAPTCDVHTGRLEIARRMGGECARGVRSTSGSLTAAPARARQPPRRPPAPLVGSAGPPRWSRCCRTATQSY